MKAHDILLGSFLGLVSGIYLWYPYRKDFEALSELASKNGGTLPRSDITKKEGGP